MGFKNDEARVLWKAFEQTGNPYAYILYHEAQYGKDLSEERVR